MSIKVEVFSAPGCSSCYYARQILKAVAAEFGEDRVVWRDVNILEEMDYAVALGVLVTPSIAIDGELEFPQLPSAAKLREALTTRLGQTAPGSDVPEHAPKR
ncbi:thioredoxin family protein [Cupriavidus basilensis]